ncbi:MAG: hypothetical protein IJT98_04795 [Prevotella sp.]|nr:hypothetical protein [Prevotella sp.]
MQRLSFLLLSLFLLTSSANAQVLNGVVKSIGRPDRPGQVLAGATVRMRGVVNPVVTSATGQFSVNMTGKNEGDAIYVQSVQKQGYELQDRGLAGRPLVFSNRVPIEILMVNTAQLQADRQRIEANAYRRAERNYQQRQNQLEEQLQQQTISADEYRRQLQELQDQYEKYLTLISDLADRYARTDYDQLDSIDRVINICIEEGELERADSLIHTIFDPETVLERNRQAKQEIAERIAFAQSIIDKAQADRDAILRDVDYAQRVMQLCENLAAELLAAGEREKAIECLQKELQMKTALYGEQSEEAQAVSHRIEELTRQ